MNDETCPTIPPPSGDRDVRVVNVFARMVSANATPLPLFDHLGPGAMVVTGAILVGGPDGLGGGRGAFLHDNSVQELALVHGSSVPSGGVGAPGSLRVNRGVHGNRRGFEAATPDEAVVLTLTQRQPDPDREAPQREAIVFPCVACGAEVHRFDEDPPASPPEDGLPLFATVWASAVASTAYSADERLRTCPACGHVNDPLPDRGWGWRSWLAQHRGATAARRSLRAAAEEVGHRG